MAKRGVLEHPKFSRLKTLLCVNKSTALGYLECLWQFTGRFTPQGNIGKYTDADIEAWLEWGGEEGKLIESLVVSGWVETDQMHRLLIHDWHEHADNTTKISLKRNGQEFLTCKKLSQQCLNSVSTVLQPPEPIPEPEPVITPPPVNLSPKGDILTTSPSTGEVCKSPQKRAKAPPASHEAIFELLPPSHVTQRIREAWANYEAVRRAKHWKPFTLIGLKGKAALLAKYPPEVAAEMIERSVANEWQGIFEPRGNGPPKGRVPRTMQQEFDEVMEVFRKRDEQQAKHEQNQAGKRAIQEVSLSLPNGDEANAQVIWEGST